MQKIKAVLFDLDNTLIDFMQMKQQACKAAFAAMVSSGLKMEKETTYDELMDTYFAVGLESDAAFTQFLKKVGQFDHRILAASINAYLETKARFVKPYPNVKSVLKKLKRKDLILAVVTDAPKTKAFQRLLAMKLEEYFSFVVGFEDTGEKKHTGLPLRLALEQIKSKDQDLANSEILMVGDSLERDLRPAKKMGLQTALATYGQFEKEIFPEGIVDFELAGFEELLDIV
jgi:HAD superfamily hydrolase (TIGR01549 family)